MGLAGTWYNELGSKMVLKLRNGMISGTYETGVGDAVGKYRLLGAVDPKPSRFGQVVGWTVAWSNAKKRSHAVTTWCGEYQALKSKFEQIQTTWLLTNQTKPRDNWESTLVGQDVFTRTPPPKPDRRRAKPRKSAHPINY